ncbi:hypothetical protein BG003_005040 [Podila horticola]|nr:hypothetical protein BG003_005040 [Podila horticola]
MFPQHSSTLSKSLRPSPTRLFPHRAFHTTPPTLFFSSPSHDNLARITELIPLHGCLITSLMCYTLLSPTTTWYRTPRVLRARRSLRGVSFAMSTATLGLLAASMLETTPNEDRMRLLHRSPEYPHPDATELMQIRCESEKPTVVTDPEDPRVRRAKICLARLLRGVEDDGMHLKAFPPSDEDLERLMGRLRDEEVDPDWALQQENKRFGDRSFRVIVTEDRDELAGSFVGRNIILGPQCFEYAEEDPLFLDVVVAHELGHLVQEHYLETRGSGRSANGVESFLTGAAYYLRTITWSFFGRFGPVINGLWEIHQEKVIHRAVLGPCNHPLEHEADKLSIKLLARAGFDPRVVPAFWRWNEWDQRRKQAHLAAWEANSGPKAKDEERTIVSKCRARMEAWLNSTHPPHRERAESMVRAAEEIREQWVEAERRKREYLDAVNARTLK